MAIQPDTTSRSTLDSKLSDAPRPAIGLGLSPTTVLARQGKRRPAWPQVPEMDEAMHAAYAVMDVPLWCSPSSVRAQLTYARWSEEIALELGEWFARIWSRVFAAGFLQKKQPVVDAASVHRILVRMRYPDPLACQFVALLMDNLSGLYAKGVTLGSSHREGVAQLAARRAQWATQAHA